MSDCFLLSYGSVVDITTDSSNVNPTTQCIEFIVKGDYVIRVTSSHQSTNLPTHSPTPNPTTNPTSTPTANPTSNPTRQQITPPTGTTQSTTSNEDTHTITVPSSKRRRMKGPFSEEDIKDFPKHFPKHSGPFSEQQLQDLQQQLRLQRQQIQQLQQQQLRLQRQQIQQLLLQQQQLQQQKQQQLLQQQQQHSPGRSDQTRRLSQQTQPMQLLITSQRPNHHVSLSECGSYCQSLNKMDPKCICVDGVQKVSNPNTFMFTPSITTLKGYEQRYFTVLSNENVKEQQFILFQSELNIFNNKTNPVSFSLTPKHSTNILLNNLGLLTNDTRKVNRVHLNIPDYQTDDSLLQFRAIPLGQPLKFDRFETRQKTECILDEDAHCQLRLNPNIDYNIVVQNMGKLSNNVSLYTNVVNQSIQHDHLYLVSNKHGVNGPIIACVAVIALVFAGLFFLLFKRRPSISFSYPSVLNGNQGENDERYEEMIDDEEDKDEYIY